MIARPRRWRVSDQRGSATVELAMAMPAIVLVLGLIAGTAAWGQRAILVEHAAAATARAALVEDLASARAAGMVIAPGARVVVARVPGAVTATVSLPGRGLLPPVEATMHLPEQP